MSDDAYGFCDCQLGGLHPFDPNHPRHGERRLTEKERQNWNWFEASSKKTTPPEIAALIREFAEARKRARSQG